MDGMLPFFVCLSVKCTDIIPARQLVKNEDEIYKTTEEFHREGAMCTNQATL
jgi:hypothetical protein